MTVHTLHENPDTQHLAAIGDAIERAQSWLREQQHDDGYWVGMLESNPCMEAEWILAAHVLGVDDQALVGRLRQSLLNRQRDDGSWEIYHEAPAEDINATVECYAALRASGLEPDTDALASARG